MATKFPDLFAALTAPFHIKEIRELDPNKEGTPTARRRPMLKYITAPTVKTRLDDVLGPENWWAQYVPLGPDLGVECRLTIRLPDESTVTKTGAGAGKDLKAAYSDALKRAGEEFGIGRHLRPATRLPTYTVGPRAGPGPEPAPQSAPPAPVHEPHTAPTPPFQPARRHHDQVADWGDTAHREPAANGQRERLPKTGKQLFGWAKEQEQKFEVGLLKYLTQWGKLQDFPGRIVDWSDVQVTLAVAEALRKLQNLSSTGADVYAEESLGN